MSRGPEPAKDEKDRAVEVQVEYLRAGVELAWWIGIGDDAEQGGSLLFTREAWANLTGQVVEVRGDDRP